MDSSAQRDEIWNAVFNTRYDAAYNHLVCDSMVDRWQRVHDLTSVIVALTVSGSAISGWALWTVPEFRPIWAGFAGVGAILAIVHSTLAVHSRLRNWGQSKREFVILQTGLETLQLEMKVDPEFSTEDFMKRLLQFRENLKLAILSLDNDILCTRRLRRRCQDELNEQTASNS